MRAEAEEEETDSREIQYDGNTNERRPPRNTRRAQHATAQAKCGMTVAACNDLYTELTSKQASRTTFQTWPGAL